jgi:hypothetical protein
MFSGYEATYGGLERVVEDEYKFLNRNVQKLFGMVGNLKNKWCKSCGKFHWEVEVGFSPLRPFCKIRRGRRMVLA